jgi:hypothetical protein
LLGNGAQGVIGEFQHHVIVGEQPLVLTGQRVTRPGENADQGRLVQRLQGGQHREAADEFGNQPEAAQVLRLGGVQTFGDAAGSASGLTGSA